VEKRRFILVTLRPLILSPLNDGRQVTGILSGLPVKDDREFIAIWNEEKKKHHITGIQGVMISKIHWLLGDGEDAEDGLVFFGPRRDSEGRVDVLESKQVMRKAVNLVGVLFKKLIVSANVEPNEENLIAKPTELHLGYPNHDFSTSAVPTEAEVRRRIEQTPLAKKETEQKGSPALSGARQTSLLPESTTPPARTHTKPRTHTYSREPTLLTRRPNQHVRKRVEEIKKLLREKVDVVPEKALVVVDKTVDETGGGNGSIGAIARRTGGAAGSLCTTCGNFYECQRQVEDYTCDAYIDDRKNKMHLSSYPDGL
jgi:hypothetical protein